MESRDQLSAGATSAAAHEQLREDFEISQYIRTFIAASDRVRYVLFAVIIAFLFVFALYKNSDPEGWLDNRLDRARYALHHEAWKECGKFPGPDEVKSLEELKVWVGRDHHTRQDIKQHFAIIAKINNFDFDELKRCRQVLGGADLQRYHDAEGWAEDYQLKSADEVRNRLNKFEETQIRDVFFARVPFLNIGFDVNDLSIFSSLLLSFLMLVMVFSIARQHENLFLSLWKVRQVHLAEGRRINDGNSKANLFYHALSMAQVFSDPPTLARWGGGWLGKRYRYWSVGLLFLLPFVAMLLIVKRDSETIPAVWYLNKQATLTGTIFEWVGLVVVLMFGVRSAFHARACHKLWETAFFELNPSYLDRQQAVMAAWLKQRGRRGPKKRCSVPNARLFGPNGIESCVHSLLDGKLALVLFEDENLSGRGALLSESGKQAAGNAADQLVVIRISSQDTAVPDCYHDPGRQLTREWRASRGSVVIVTPDRKRFWFGWRPSTDKLKSKIKKALAK